MYSPKYAIETDRKLIDQVISENAFATIVYQEDGVPQSFQLPLMLKNEKLIGHMAKANKAWKALNGRSTLVIFYGPHCYISPTWYGTDHNVPTWNYITVHVRGAVRIVEEEAFLKEAIIELSQKYDPTFPIEANIASHQGLLREIVGIEIQVEQVFSKFKLAQSKPEHERLNVVKQLEKSPNQNDRLVAKAMLKTMDLKS